MVKVIYADNSGPIFQFEGKTSSKFLDDLLKWFDQQIRNGDGSLPPIQVESSRDGKKSKITWQWDGNETNVVALVVNGDAVEVDVSGDAEEIATPDRTIFEQTLYTDDNGEVVREINGKTYCLPEIVQILDEHELRCKTKAGSKKPKNTK